MRRYTPFLIIRIYSFSTSFDYTHIFVFYILWLYAHYTQFFDCTQVVYIQSIRLYADISWILYTSTTYFMQRITLRKLQVYQFFLSTFLNFVQEASLAQRARTIQILSLLSYLFFNNFSAIYLDSIINTNIRLRIDNTIFIGTIVQSHKTCSKAIGNIYYFLAWP